MRDYFDGKYKDGEIHPKLWEATYRKLSEATVNGFGAISYKDSSPEVINELKTNTAVFSAFKNHAQSKELSALLVDKKGKQRSWGEFKKEALKVDAKYNQLHLGAEFNYATRAARSAKQWQDFENTKHLYPNLEYLKSRSGTPRESHEKFYGIIKPIDDSFWNHTLPPNGWGCKCSVRKSREEPTAKDIEPIEPTPGLPGNSGKTRQVFTKNHPVVKNTSKKDKKRIQKQLVKLFDLDDDYVRIKVGKKGRIDVHVNADKSDLLSNVDYAQTVIKKNGGEFTVLKHSNVKGVKNPEYKYKGIVGDRVQFNGEKIRRHINNTFKSKATKNGQMGKYEQCWIGFDLMSKLNSSNIYEVARGFVSRFKTYSNVKFVTVKNGEKVMIIKNKELDVGELMSRIKKELL